MCRTAVLENRIALIFKGNARIIKILNARRLATTPPRFPFALTTVQREFPYIATGQMPARSLSISFPHISLPRAAERGTGKRAQHAAQKARKHLRGEALARAQA
jgi:hypothetical protein